KYTEEINDNNEFFGKVRQQYARKDSRGRDIHVVTDWMAGRMIQLGYVQKLDHAELPNVSANLLDKLQHPGFDKNRDFSVPSQSGRTGIASGKALVHKPIKSVNDIFDPEFKGKVSMLTEMRDTVGLVMLGMGEDPENFSGTDPALKAIDKI